MKRKPKPKNTNRRNFLKSGFSLGAGAIAGSGMICSCNSNEAQTGKEKVKVLLPNGELAEVDEHAIHAHVHQVSNEEAREGDPNKEYVMVIDLAKCRNARKCVDSCQGMHHLPPEDEWIKVYLMRDSEDTAPYWFPKPCFHCNSPSCVNVCPVGATFKRKDGLVLVDNERWKGWIGTRRQRTLHWL
jgi:molybdopterin-containing oxidoreductase family iron-sulfur binding subunit